MNAILVEFRDNFSPRSDVVRFVLSIFPVWGPMLGEVATGQGRQSGGRADWHVALALLEE